VEITDTIGQKTLIGPRMIQLVNGGNLAPFGFLDLPQEGSVIGTAVEIGGWALDDRGVARVELLVDGVLVGSAFYGISRPDVAIVFPGYPNDPLAGFVSLMNTSGLSAGTHFLVARIFDVQGLSTDLPARRVVKQ
jgi:N-acetylmuramoyl-L-alanine amidase